MIVSHCLSLPLWDELFAQVALHLRTLPLSRQCEPNEVFRHRLERIGVPGHLCRALALIFSLRVDALADQRKPPPRLLAGIIKGDRAVFAERSAGWIR
jgi:hypothetical protein